MLNNVKNCITVAEIGINHNGDLKIAKELIKCATQSGCDYVKFQKRDINLVYTEEELNKPRESPWGTTTRQQKMGLEFTEQDYNEIDKYCKDLNIGWFASPWDCNSVDFLMKYDMPYFKIASALITDFELLSKLKSTNKPLIISTGMSTKGEIQKAVDFLGTNLQYILACRSTYPTPTADMNLNFINTLKVEFPEKKIGFSNHHPGILFAVASTLLGAEMVEFHITLDRSMYGSDQSASIELPGMVKIIDYIKDLQSGLGTGEWGISEKEIEVKKKLRKK